MVIIRQVVAVAAVVAAPVAGRPTTGAGDESCTKTTVAILGAGMAGIAAAQGLTNNSITDFIILEYNHRIGGRASHANFGTKDDGTPYVVELGANWIQGLGRTGAPENPIYRLAKKHGLENIYSNYSSILTYNETGPTDYSQLLDDYGEADNEASIRAGRLLKENLQDETYRSGLALAGWNPRHDDMAAQAAEWWKFDFNDAVPPEEASLIFGAANDNVTFAQFGDANNFVIDQRGYSHIIEREAATFLRANDARLRLNAHVTNVSYSDSGVTVRTADGACVEASYALCTFSVGVLQDETLVGFEPQLPEWKRSAIQAFTMTTYTKIFLQFNETFWPEDRQYFLYASPKRRGYYPLFQSLSTEGFMPGSHIIFVTVVAEEAYRVERQTDAETRAEVMAVLRDMYEGSPERAGRPLPEPTAFMYPRWTGEAWARGSYSNWPPGTTLERHQNLRANTGRLWFAGEATSAQYFGYLHGAWFEGREAAYQVAGLVRAQPVRAYGDDGGSGTAEIGGERRRYEVLHGSSPLEQYTLLNGWATSSFGWGESEEGKKR